MTIFTTLIQIEISRIIKTPIKLASVWGRKISFDDSKIELNSNTKLLFSINFLECFFNKFHFASLLSETFLQTCYQTCHKVASALLFLERSVSTWEREISAIQNWFCALENPLMSSVHLVLSVKCSCDILSPPAFTYEKATEKCTGGS